MWHCLICQGDPKNNTFSKWYINTSCHKTFTHLVMDKPYYITHVQYFLLKYPYIKLKHNAPGCLTGGHKNIWMYRGMQGHE
jgi:hypothetical protein